MLNPIGIVPKFSANLPPINSYAQEVSTIAEKKPFIKVYQATQADIPHPWLFIHRQNGYKGINVLPIVEDERGNQFVHILKIKRPPMGGKITLELPAGAIGDGKNPNEDNLTAAKRELAEETGYDVKQIKMLADNEFPLLPGLATELNSFAVALVEDKGKKLKLDDSEQMMIQGNMKVPIAVFSDHKLFSDWLKQMDRENYLVGQNILLARALMPPLEKNRLNITA